MQPTMRFCHKEKGTRTETGTLVFHPHQKQPAMAKQLASPVAAVRTNVYEPVHKYIADTTWTPMNLEICSEREGKKHTKLKHRPVSVQTA